MAELRKIRIAVVEWYPYLAIGEPADAYEEERAVQVPGELFARLQAAEAEVYSAKAAILKHLHAADQVPAYVFDDFGHMLTEEKAP